MSIREDIEKIVLKYSSVSIEDAFGILLTNRDITNLITAIESYHKAEIESLRNEGMFDALQIIDESYITLDKHKAEMKKVLEGLYISDIMFFKEGSQFEQDKYCEGKTEGFKEARKEIHNKIDQKIKEIGE